MTTHDPPRSDERGPGGQPPVWVPPPWAALPRPPAHPHATTSIVLGTISVVGSFALFPLLLAPFAWYFGAVAVREAEREPARWSSSGSARAGRVLGIIGSAMLAAGLLLLSALVGLIVITFRQGGDYGAHVGALLTTLI